MINYKTEIILVDTLYKCTHTWLTMGQKLQLEMVKKSAGFDIRFLNSVNTKRCQQKKYNLEKMSCLLLFEGTYTSLYKDKKSKRSHKTVGIKVFLTIISC